MRHVRAALAIGAIALWVAAFAGVIATPWVPAIERFDTARETVLSAAITATLLWAAQATRGRWDGTHTTYRAGYLAGRADEREAQKPDQRVRTVQIDGIEATVIGGENQPVSEETIRVIQQIREGMQS